MSSQQITISSPEKPHNMDEWLLDVLNVIIAGGKVEPQKVLIERAREMLATFGWQSIKRLLKERGIEYPDDVERVAIACPNLPELLRTDTGREAILDYPKQHPKEIASFHHKIIKLNDLVLSVQMGQIQDAKEIWARFWDIVAEGQTTTEEATDAE